VSVFSESFVLLLHPPRNVIVTASRLQKSSLIFLLFGSAKTQSSLCWLVAPPVFVTFHFSELIHNDLLLENVLHFLYG
jgi:hypothetical protein